MEVTALTQFAHDRIDAKKGDKIEMPDSTAKELEIRGLVTTGKVPAAATPTAAKPNNPRPARTRKPAEPKNKMAPATNNQSVQTSGQTAPASPATPDPAAKVE
jgi:hypothetical protein